MKNTIGLQLSKLGECFFELYIFLFPMSYHIRARRKMLAEGKNGSIRKMPFEELCDLLAEAIKAVPSEKVIKTCKQTLLSLPKNY